MKPQLKEKRGNEIKRKRQSVFNKKPRYNQMLRKAVIQDFLNRKLDDFYWMKDLSKEDLLNQISTDFPDFKFYMKPFAHQAVSFLLGANLRRFLFFLDMGCGKTALALALAMLYKQQNIVKKILVCVPNVLNIEGWLDEVKLHSNLKAVSLRTLKEDREDLLQDPTIDIYIVNYDQLNVIVTEFRDKPIKRSKKKEKEEEETKSSQERVIIKDKIQKFSNYFDMIIFDELHNVKNPSSLSFGVCDYLSEKMKCVFALSGTPIGRKVHEFWGIYYLVDRGETLGNTPQLFLQAFFNSKPSVFGSVKYEVMPDKAELLYKTLRHRSIRYSDKEITDLPELHFITKKIPMTPDMAKIYNLKIEQALNSKKKEEVEYLENLYIIQRQLVSGYFKAESFEEKELLKISVTCYKNDLLEQIVTDMPSNERFIIFHVFTESGRNIASKLRSLGIKFVQMNALSENSKTEELRLFKSQSNIRCAVINIASGSEGLNLQEATCAIFYEPTDRVIKYKQAYKRMHRTGQKRSCRVIEFITKNSVEEKIKDFLNEGNDVFETYVEGDFSKIHENKEDKNENPVDFYSKLLGLNNPNHADNPILGKEVKGVIRKR